MLIAIAALIVTCVAFLFVLVTQVAQREPDVLRRLEEGVDGLTGRRTALQRRNRQERAERLQAILMGLGARLEGRRQDATQVRQFLIHAGYINLSAVSMYLGARVVLAAGLAGAAIFFLPLFGTRVPIVILASIWGGLMGWVGPVFYVGRRVRRRQKEIVRALPDALDMLVVCVEAGLALNGAMLRVSEEIVTISPVLGEQLGLVNLEIRAGTPRDDALRNLGERTGVEDVRSFVGMLIQTEKFGTSIAQALRIHADVLRTKRRQRAEEASAKTAIKMLFPLVFFIFPAMFVVILGPAFIQVLRALSSFR